MSDEGARVELVIADPFELGGRRLRGHVVDELFDDRARVLIRLEEPVEFAAKVYRFLVLAQRDGHLPHWPREVAGLGLTSEPKSRDDAWGTTHWRGGLGLVGTAELLP